MGLFDRLKVWASDPGNKTERSDADIARGWRDGEAPWSNEWNYQENARDRRINTNTADIRAISTMSIAKSAAHLCAENHAYNAADDPESPLNSYVVGTEVRDSCIGWDASTNTAVVWILDVDGLIRPITNAWNLDAAPVLGSALSLVFPVTAGGILGICCDASYLYVLWFRDSDDLVCVSRYAAVNGSFSVNADWTYTTASVVDIDRRAYQIIDALDGTNLCILYPTLSAPYVLVGVLSKTGVTYTSGIGNAPTSGISVDRHALRIVSDGVHVYWIITQLSGSNRITYLASARINAIASSDYSFLTVVTNLDTDWVYQPRDIIARDGVVNLMSASGRVYRFRGDDDRVDPVLNVTPTFADTTTQHGISAGYDGMNIWVAARTLNVSDDVDSLTFLKIPGGWCGKYDGRASVTSVEIPASRVSVAGVSDYTGYRAGDFRFDGRSMWFIGRFGYVYRITNPGGR